MSEQMTDYDAPRKQVKPAAWKGLIFFFVLVAILAALGFFVLQNRSVDGPLVPAERPVPISVETITVELAGAFVAEEKFTGIVTPRRTSQLGFSGGGRIAALQVDVGDQVERGDTLAVLDTRSLRAQLAAANAMITEAEAAYDLADATVDRQITLLERGHVSSQRVDEARAQAQTALERYRRGFAGGS